MYKVWIEIAAGSLIIGSQENYQQYCEEEMA
jgi:hypothetical protein